MIMVIKKVNLLDAVVKNLNLLEDILKKVNRVDAVVEEKNLLKDLVNVKNI